MSGGDRERSVLDVMSDMLMLTRRMADSGDADFLVSSIDERGQLIEEYDRLKASESGARAIKRDKAELKKMIGEIAGLNKKIDASLKTLRDEARREVENALANQKVLNYTNNAISSSGSYMDFKK